jgi:hypothetical protein
MVTVVETDAPPIGVVVKFHVPTRLPAPDPVGPSVDASGLPDGALLQLARRAPQSEQTETGSFIISRPPLRLIRKTVRSRRSLGQGRTMEPQPTI